MGSIKEHSHPSFELPYTISASTIAKTRIIVPILPTNSAQKLFLCLLSLRIKYQHQKIDTIAGRTITRICILSPPYIYLQP
jgi:hypothetical protein